MGEERNVAVATKQTVLGELLNEQSNTKEMLNHLEEKLRPVSSPQPQDGSTKDRLSDHHLATAVDTQREINSHIRYIIDTLVV